MQGIVIRGQGTPTVCGGQRPAGQRANQKRMATVGAVYTGGPYQRTAADVVAALFREMRNHKACHAPSRATSAFGPACPTTAPSPRAASIRCSPGCDGYQCLAAVRPRRHHFALFHPWPLFR